MQTARTINVNTFSKIVSLCCKVRNSERVASFQETDFYMKMKIFLIYGNVTLILNFNNL